MKAYIYRVIINTILDLISKELVRVLCRAQISANNLNFLSDY